MQAILVALFGPSWQPKVLAVLAMSALAIKAASAVLDSDPNTNPDWVSLGGSASAVLALFRTRQTNVTSEQHQLTQA